MRLGVLLSFFVVPVIHVKYWSRCRTTATSFHLSHSSPSSFPVAHFPEHLISIRHCSRFEVFINGGDGNQTINTKLYGVTEAVIRALSSVSDFNRC